MVSFQCRKLLAKSEVFEKQRAMTVEESEDHTRQEYNRVYHVGVLSRFACEWQCRILLKSQADGILARDNSELLPKYEVFEQKVPASTEDSEHCSS